MSYLLPSISMSELQRAAKEKLEAIKDYAVIQRHGKDVAFVLHPALGKVLLETGLLDVLKKKVGLDTPATPLDASATNASSTDQLPELDRLIGQVLRELSRR